MISPSSCGWMDVYLTHPPTHLLGFKVLLFERDMSLQDRIVGELLQPGGVRALERMGLDECAKEGIDSVGVDGYVVFTPNKKVGMVECI